MSRDEIEDEIQAVSARISTRSSREAQVFDQHRVNYLILELSRRDAERRERYMLGLTVAIFALTFVNAIFVGWSVFGC